MRNYEKVICECNVKINFANIYEIKIDTEKLKKNFKPENLVNLKILKCYKILFTKEGIITNIGSYIILSIILFYIMFLSLFIFIGYNSLKKRIQVLVNLEKKIITKIKINKQITQGDKNNKKNKKEDKLKGTENKNEKKK